MFVNCSFVYREPVVHQKRYLTTRVAHRIYMADKRFLLRNITYHIGSLLARISIIHVHPSRKPINSSISVPRYRNTPTIPHHIMYRHIVRHILILSLVSKKQKIKHVKRHGNWDEANASNTWAASSEFGTYRLCEQRRFRRACASA